MTEQVFKLLGNESEITFEINGYILFIHALGFSSRIDLTKYKVGVSTEHGMLSVIFVAGAFQETTVFLDMTEHYKVKEFFKAIK